MSKRMADLLVETPQAAGVKTCYGIVGDTLNRIAQAIDRSEIDWVHMRHEEAGAFAAGAEAQFTTCAGTYFAVRQMPRARDLPSQAVAAAGRPVNSPTHTTDAFGGEPQSPENLSDQAL
jgi:hypothetical protein